jgi:quinol monooxygenase YgiN
VTAVAVLATLAAAPEHADALRIALLRLAGAAAGEPGTELFQVNESAGSPGRFVVFERYRDDAAVTAHRTSAAMAQFRDALRGTGTSPDIAFLTPLAH